MNDIELIQNKIYEIRGQRIMLNFDLALPFVFTEHGALMLSSIFRSKVAVEISIKHTTAD